jgi:Tol biopolymer transport system component
MPFDFPNIYHFDTHLTNRNFPSLYNASLNYVVYPYYDGDLHGYTMRDLRIDENIAFVQSSFKIGGGKWSPNGEIFVVTGDPNFSFYQLSKGGTVDQLTEFEAPELEMAIHDHFSWSPDGSRIAFWLFSRSFTPIGEYLYMLDLDNETVIDLCLFGNIYLGWSPAPIWSPDGNWIVFERNSFTDTNATILVDLKENRAYSIGENLTPIFWLNNIPAFWLEK